MRINKNGFLLIETLVGLAILTILFGMAFGIISFAAKQVTVNRLLVTQQRLTQTLSRLSSSPAALRAAAFASPSSEPYNSYYSFCVNGQDYSQPCINENGDGFYRPFRLYLADVTNTISASGGIYGLKTSGAITGVPNYPMRYDANGNLCDMSTGDCPTDLYPVEAFTEFLPVCYNQWESYWRGWGASQPAEPLYPTAYAPLPTCLFSHFLKIRLTVRASAYSGTGPRPQTVFNTTVDTFIVHWARQ